MSFKFCPECGAALEPRARFCGSCGKPVGQGGGAPAALPLAGIVSLVALLVLGGGFWLYFRLAPEGPRPLKPGERAPGIMASAPPGAGAGRGAAHPPFELPEDIKTYMADLQKEADASPGDAKKWKTLSGVYYRASRLDRSYIDRAKAAFEHLVELDENDLDGLRGLGNIAYDQQDRKTAISYYERYLARAPADAEVRTDLGTMYYEEKQPERAIAEYQRVLATSPSFYQAYFNLAVVHDAAGDREAAHAALEKARDLSTAPAVKKRIEDLLEVARTQELSLPAAAERLAGPAATSPPGAPAAGQKNATVPADSFQGAVEQLFRGHRIAGPKVVAIQWPEPGKARVLMANFPMDQMPEVMKTGYLGKMAKGVEEARARFDVDGPVVVELVDQATGKVMATVDPSQSPS